MNSTLKKKVIVDVTTGLFTIAFIFIRGQIVLCIFHSQEIV